MNIQGIDHVQLAMPAGEEDQARKFYHKLLGVPEVPKPPDLAKRGGVWFEDDRVRIHLGVDKNFQPAGKAHIAFLVDNVSELASRCSEEGYRIVDDEPLDGYIRIYVYDPFGNRLEFMEPVA